MALPPEPAPRSPSGRTGAFPKSPSDYSPRPSESPPGSPYHRISTYKPPTPHRRQYSPKQLLTPPPNTLYGDDLSPYVESPPSRIVYTEEIKTDVATEALDIFKARESERNEVLKVYTLQLGDIKFLFNKAGIEVKERGYAEDLPKEVQQEQEPFITEMYRNRIMIIGYNTMLKSDRERIYNYWTQGMYIPDEFDPDLSQNPTPNEQMLWVRNILNPLLYTPWGRSLIRVYINALAPNLRNSCVRRLKKWLVNVEEPFKSFLYNDRFALYHELIQGNAPSEDVETESAIEAAESAIEAAVEPSTPENTSNKKYDPDWETLYPVQGSWQPGTPEDLRRKHRFDRYNRHTNSESATTHGINRELFSVLKL